MAVHRSTESAANASESAVRSIEDAIVDVEGDEDDDDATALWAAGGPGSCSGCWTF